MSDLVVDKKRGLLFFFLTVITEIILFVLLAKPLRGDTHLYLCLFCSVSSFTLFKNPGICPKCVWENEFT